MDRFVFTSDELPQDLAGDERFKTWIERYNDGFGVRGDFTASEAPFEARMSFAWIGDLILARANLTATSGEFGGRHRATAEDEARMGFLVNTSAHPVQSTHRGRDDVLLPGGFMLLSRADQGRLVGSSQNISWVIIDIPRITVTHSVPHSEDLVGEALSTGASEALRMASAYIGLVLQDNGFADPRLDAHVSRTLLDLITLAVGAEKDVAEQARHRGLRAARLDTVLHAIAKGYTDASFSIANVASKMGLSQRYVQELLHSTGMGFAERVLELRLQRSVTLLARAEATRRKVSDIALASGFNDVSYFHRCFRRRFGMTPTGARA